MLTKLRKAILLTMGLGATLIAQNATSFVNYQAEIEVQSRKINGKPWDISGGAPDLYMRVDGQFVTFNKVCKDTYRCTTNTFLSDKAKFYIEIYDKDLASDDLIGKGECRVGERCKLGQSVVTIDIKPKEAITLAYARFDTKMMVVKIDRSIDTVSIDLLSSTDVNNKTLQQIIDKIILLRGYGKDIDSKTKQKLRLLVQKLKKMKGVDKNTLETLEHFTLISQTIMA